MVLILLVYVPLNTPNITRLNPEREERERDTDEVMRQRGGAGNIGSPHVRPSTPGVVHDNVVIPDSAVRESLDGDYHIGVSPPPSPSSLSIIPLP